MERMVEHIQDGVIRMTCHGPGDEAAIAALGAKRSGVMRTRWEVAYGTDEELAHALGRLRDAGFAFAGGQAGWPPAAIFEQLRARGLVEGPFTEVTWLGPGKPVFTTK